MPPILAGRQVIERRHKEPLRAHGFDDRALHDACAITACYAFVDRIAAGPGVELEAGEGVGEGERTP